MIRKMNFDEKIFVSFVICRFSHISMKCSLRNAIFNEIGLKIVTISMKWITWLSNFVCEILLKIESYHFLIKYLVRKVIFLNRIWRIPRKSFLSDLPIFGHEMTHFLPFFVWYRWIYFGCFFISVISRKFVKNFFLQKINVCRLSVYCINTWFLTEYCF